ncbi:MAG TPA: T9SS type A sorting domain-containing protein [Flavobacteriales bacterium]|nr:T9SS type A sorting domain-containing protein [Flavobacteriales bacterium]
MTIGFTGYRHRAYEGDSIVLGQPAQRIRTTGMQVYPLWQDTVWINEVHHTSLQGDLLMLLVNSPTGQLWDTLLRFDAVPGDAWYLPNYDQHCAGQEPFGQIQVLDTGHVVVDGVTLRQWAYGSLGANGEVIAASAYYFERIGFLYGLLPYPYCDPIIDAGEVLSCYFDSDLTYITAWAQPAGTCDFTLGAPSPASTHGITVAPNPGREQLMLSLPASSHRVNVIDALGRTIITYPSLSGSTPIATAHLPSGAYLIRIESADGSRTSLRWIKE